MRRVRVHFSPMGQRWEVDVVGAEHLAIEAVEHGDLTIWSDRSGQVTAIVIDSARPEADVLEVVAGQFGREVADRLTQPSDDEIDEVFVLDDMSDTTVVRSNTARTRSPLVVLGGEPGVPVPVGEGRFRFVVEIGPRAVEGVLEHDRVDARIRVEIELPATDDPLWIRVAEGDTGAILALAPLQRSGERSSAAEVAFGLAVPMQMLHFSVSDDPLDDPGKRADRRRTWAIRLEDRASRRARGLRADATTLFEQAADVHATLGDVDSAERCRDLARRARRRRRLLGGFGLVLVASVLVVVGFWLGRTDPEGARVVEARPATTIFPVVTLPTVAPWPGPVDLVFDDGQEAQIVVTSDGSSTSRTDLEFVVRSRIRSSITFERLVDCVGSETGNSLVGGDGPMYQPTFIPVLTNVSDPTVGARAFAPFSVERSADTYFVLPGACEAAWTRDGEPFDATATATYTPHKVTVELPDDLESGAWELNLVLENVEGKATDDRYPTIQVERRVP